MAAKPSCSARWPPAFNGIDYETWKRDVKLWCKLTDYVEEKHAIAIHLSLEGRARDASSEIDSKKLESKSGVDALLARLDEVFLPNKGRRQFAAFQELYNLRRDKDRGIDAFVDTFEHTYFKFKAQGMVLPDPVMAFMLLASCNLVEDKIQLVMSAISEVTYDRMKETIKRVFGDKVGCGSKTDEVKIEPVFEAESSVEGEALYTRGSSYGRRGWGQQQRGRGGRARGHRGGQRGGYGPAYSAPQSSWRKTNPLDSEGNVTRCRICDSRFHWAMRCPDAYENIEEKSSSQGNSSNHEENEGDSVHLSLFMGYTNGAAREPNKLSGLVPESYGCALLDTGCSTTVCGEDWLENYREYMSEHDRSCIIEKPSTATFTFGDGKRVGSNKIVKLPCYINGKRSTVDTDVVTCNIPLLLSKKAMKKGKMILNFEKDALTVGNNVVSLNSAASGHYLLPISL